MNPLGELRIESCGGACLAYVRYPLGMGMQYVPSHRIPDQARIIIAPVDLVTGTVIVSAEQKARDMLDRMGVAGAQRMTAGELVELANLIAYADAAEKK